MDKVPSLIKIRKIGLFGASPFETTMAKSCPPLLFLIAMKIDQPLSLDASQEA